MSFNKKAVQKHICERLAHGEPIQTILNPQPKVIRFEDGEPVYDPDFVKPDLPDWNMVVMWMKEDEQFRGDWENARKMGAAFNADQLMLLKDQLLKDPRNASAYKVAMEMVKTAAMWGDPKYSDRTIQDLNHRVPQNSDEVRAQIKQLEDELGIRDMGSVQEVGVRMLPSTPGKKQPSEAQLRHREKLSRLAKERNAAKKGTGRGRSKPNP
jgi:hypothetical protein